MSSRFRTYVTGPSRTAPLKGNGNAVLRLCAEAAFVICSLILILTTLMTPHPAEAATPAGTLISNTAAATYGDGPASGTVTRASNTVDVTTVALRTPSKTEFFSYAPTSSNATPVPIVQGAYRPSSDPSLPLLPQPLPLPAGSTTPIDLSKPVPLVPTTIYHAGEPIFVQVTDLDQNLDPFRAETVIITLTDSKTGDTEVIRLTETGPDTGVFIGYIQSTANTSLAPYNGSLPVTVDSTIKARYVDVVDGSDSSSDAALVDPYGILFDSATGKPIDGATVTLINTDTGQPATVFGDDGISPFPATVTTGATFAVNGITYSYPPGSFRYPFVNPGNYRFQVAPPTGYTAPSTATDAKLQQLPNGPFTIVNGSRLELFSINPGPALRIDIPVDPAIGPLWLQKSTDRNIVAHGDFLPYRLEVQNTDANITTPGVTISDTLPLGLRYRAGSTKINDTPAPDPTISADGRTLTFSVGDLAAKTGASVRFVVEVSAGTRLGTAVNQATARSSSGIASNLATATVQIRSDFMTSRSIIVGELILGPCDAPLDKPSEDLSGIRVYLEDGTYVLTDKNGMYHFEGVKPGTRVVQLDLDTIPKRFELLSCEENSRFARRNYSQFVDMQGGMLWRADFYLGLKQKAKGEVGLELLSSLPPKVDPTVDSETVTYRTPIQIGAVPVRNLRLTIMLADGLTYQPGTSRLGTEPLADPSNTDGVVTYNLGDLPAEWTGMVTFAAAAPRTGKTGQMTTRALLTFDTPEKKNVRTPVADNILERKATGRLTPPEPGTAPIEQVIDKGAPSETALPAARQETVATPKGARQTAMPEIVLYPHFPTFIAELSEEDRLTIDGIVHELEGLAIEKVTVVGHTDYVRIAPRSRHIYEDNFALSRARAQSVGSYLAEKLHLPGTIFTYIGKGKTEPVADNGTSEGRARNRRVEVKIRTRQPATPAQRSGEKLSGSPLQPPTAQQEKVGIQSAGQGSGDAAATEATEIRNEKDHSGIKTVAVTGLRPGEKWIDAKAEKASAAAKVMPDYNAAWLSRAEPGLSWLWPPIGHHPPIATVTIAIKHDPRNKLKLYHNGKEADPLSFEGTLKRNDNQLAVSEWHNINIIDGDNQFEAVETDEFGTELPHLKRTVHLSTAPVSAEIIPAKSILTADGKTSPAIAVLLLDKDGHPARQGSLGEYMISSSHTAKKRLEELLNSPLPSSSSRTLTYKVGEDGISMIELEPTTGTDEVVLNFTLANEKKELRTRLTPDYRDWILVGIAEGTAGYNTLSGHMENLKASGNDDRFYDRERLAFFAKGEVKGEWLLTMAYDSAKQSTGVTGNSLFQTVDPNTYYTLYGDSTNQGYEAASQRKLYLKLERKEFYALFGDYDSGLSITELSRYSRRMNGVKSEYRSKDYELTLFGSETAQAYVKDEIRGDGTSGLYRLSKPGIVINSEKITIESRDRFHSETVTKMTPLSRFVDYSIDYEAGTIFFKGPVPSRDEKLNPVYIVVEYEVKNAGKDALTYGGRGGVTILDGKLKAGATHVHEGHVNGESNLYGSDATLQLTPETKARAEFATTTTDLGGGRTSGNAYLAEITHTGKDLEGKAYYRQQETGFGLGQQKGSEAGTRKFGVDAAYKLDKTSTVGGQGYRQYNLATGAVRDFIESNGAYTDKQYGAKAGLRYVKDSLADGSSATSIQGTVGGNWKTADEKLTLRADHEQSLFGNDKNTDFPTRTIFGADYQLTKQTQLFAQEELTFGAAANSNTTRTGFKTVPWSGGTLASSLVNDMKENSERTFATVGLAQSWQISKQWSVDGSLDHNQTIRKKTGYQFNTNAPPASGGDDFTAVSLGANYTEKKLAWSNRVEYRNSDTTDKWGIISGFVNEQGLSWGWSTRLQLLHTQSIGGSSRDDVNLRLGLAYRPPLTRWIILDRLDLIFSDERTAATSTQGRRIVNNLNANYKPDGRTQLSLQYGAKYVLEKIDYSDYSGFTDLIGFEGRYDLTKDWDIGLRGSQLHSWECGQYAYSLGPSIGYNVMENAWISLGYNVVGFRDRDFSTANFTAQGPFVQFRFKFDQNSVKEGLKMIGQ